MHFKIEILSPVHIGCGEPYSGLSSLLDNGKIYCLEPDDIIHCVGYQKIDAYIQWLEEEANEFTRLETLRKQADREVARQIIGQIRNAKSRFHLKRFCEKNGLSIHPFKTAALYHLDCEEEMDGVAEVHKFTSQYHRPYIPGTEIKGAMRTAILYDLLRKDPQEYARLISEIEKFGADNRQDIDAVKNQKNVNRYITQIKSRLNNQMGRIAAQMQERLLNSPGKRDAQYDLLKTLSVSDSQTRSPEETLSVAYAEPFRTRNIFQVYHEYCRPGVFFACNDLSLNQNVKRLTEVLGFSQAQRDAVSDVQRVLRCCHEFTQDLIQEEKAFFTKFGKPDLVRQLESVQEQNVPDNPVLRIGKDEGFLSLTMGLLIKKRDFELYENVFIHAAKGKSYDSSSGGPLPKSRKIIHYAGKQWTAGWIRLVFNGKDAEPRSGNSEPEPRSKPESGSPSLESLRALQGKWRK